MKPALDKPLLDALDRLYAAFSVYPEPVDLVGSPHKDVAGMVRSLKAAPLRELTGDQIGPYAGSALLTVGGVAEYKHYLPRIVEQAVLMAPHMGTDPPIIAGRLKHAGWKNWPEREQAALRGAFLAAWSWSVDQQPGSGADASIWLCGIAALNEPVLPILDDWSSRLSEHALLQAARLGVEVEDLLLKADHDLAYWTYVAPVDRQLIVNWVTNAERIGAFNACFATVDEDNRWCIKEALRIAYERGRQ